MSRDLRVGDVRIVCTTGDITRQPDLDAIVNAANAQLAPGGGVAGAIHAAAGPGLYEECRPLAPITTGQAVITAGHGLPNRWCVHTLGPVYSQSRDPAGDLASSYRESLMRADERGATSVGFPAISTGIFGYPIDEAAPVSIGAVTATAPSLERVRLIRFVLFSTQDAAVFEHALSAAGR